MMFSHSPEYLRQCATENVWAAYADLLDAQRELHYWLARDTCNPGPVLHWYKRVFQATAYLAKAHKWLDDVG